MIGLGRITRSQTANVALSRCAGFIAANALGALLIGAFDASSVCFRKTSISAALNDTVCIETHHIHRQAALIPTARPTTALSSGGFVNLERTTWESAANIGLAAERIIHWARISTAARLAGRKAITTTTYRSSTDGLTTFTLSASHTTW